MKVIQIQLVRKQKEKEKRYLLVRVSLNQLNAHVRKYFPGERLIGYRVLT